MKLITFSGELMWTAQLGGGGVLSLDLRLRESGQAFPSHLTPWLHEHPCLPICIGACVKR